MRGGRRGGRVQCHPGVKKRSQVAHDDEYSVDECAPENLTHCFGAHVERNEEHSNVGVHVDAQLSAQCLDAIGSDSPRVSAVCMQSSSQLNTDECVTLALPTPTSCQVPGTRKGDGGGCGCLRLGLLLQTTTGARMAALPNPPSNLANDSSMRAAGVPFEAAGLRARRIVQPGE